MPRYSVIVTRDATESVTLEVAARSPGEAEAKAREEAENNWDLEWTLDDGNFHEPYTNGADLIDKVEYRTRADLLTRPMWRGMDTDTAGNPCVWLNYYACDEGHRHTEWQESWSCQCDDTCPRCDAAVAPTDCGQEASEWLGPTDAAEIALWESLPDAT